MSASGTSGQVRGPTESIARLGRSGCLLGIIAGLVVMSALLAFLYTVPGTGYPVDPDRLARVRVGMAKSEVRKILEDPKYASDDGLTWYYSSTWSLSTLHVKFDDSGRVSRIYLGD